MISKDRIKNVYPINYLLDHNVRISFGSDWPISTPVPLDSIEVAVTHRALGMPEESEVFIPHHRISVLQAIRSYTISSAEVLGYYW